MAFSIIKRTPEQHRAALGAIGIKLPKPDKSPIPTKPSPFVGSGPKKSDWEAARAAGHAPTSNPARVARRALKPKPKKRSVPKKRVTTPKKRATSPKKGGTPKPPPKTTGGPSTTIKPVSTKLGTGANATKPSTGDGTSKSTTDKGLDAQAKKAIDELYAPLVAQVKQDRARMEENHKLNQSDLDAYKAWAAGNLATSQNAISQGITSANAATAAALKAAQDAMAAKSAEIQGRSGVIGLSNPMTGTELVNDLTSMNRAAEAADLAANNAYGVSAIGRTGFDTQTLNANVGNMLSDLSRIRNRAEDAQRSTELELTLKKAQDYLKEKSNLRQAQIDEITARALAGEKASQAALNEAKFRADVEGKNADRRLKAEIAAKDAAAKQRRLDLQEQKLNDDRTWRAESLKVQKRNLDLNRNQKNINLFTKTQQMAFDWRQQELKNRDGVPFSDDDKVRGAERQADQLAGIPGLTRAQKMQIITAIWGRDAVAKALRNRNL